MQNEWNWNENYRKAIENLFVGFSKVQWENRINCRMMQVVRRVLFKKCVHFAELNTERKKKKLFRFSNDKWAGTLRLFLNFFPQHEHDEHRIATSNMTKANQKCFHLRFLYWWWQKNAQHPKIYKTNGPDHQRPPIDASDIVLGDNKMRTKRFSEFF